jgi:hypothetical protein
MALEYMEIELYSINITSISFNFKVIGYTLLGYTLFWICSILFQVSQEHCKAKIHNLINNK